MEVRLIEHTQNAKELLIFTKWTRREMSHKMMDEILDMTEEEKDRELEYVFQTISSPWEFINYTFFISGVTRAFTHQLVRHRVGTAFAQQAQRMKTVGDRFGYLATGATEADDRYHDTMRKIQSSYSDMIARGIPAQDARGVLPTNVLTNIAFKVNLRALNGIMNIRMCVRAQGEFQNVALAMRREVLKVHPWAEKVLLPFCLEWGSCRFPHFENCPVKREHPWINPVLEQCQALEEEAQLTWAGCVGIHEPQPE